MKTLRTVILEGNSNSIHVPTMILSCTNTSFWIAYGLVSHQIAIVIPNGIGLILGIMQALLCLFYPRRSLGRTLVVEQHDDNGDERSGGGGDDDSNCHDDDNDGIVPPEEGIPTIRRPL